jgi:hypothetical protein
MNDVYIRHCERREAIQLQRPWPLFLDFVSLPGANGGRMGKRPD